MMIRAYPWIVLKEKLTSKEFDEIKSTVWAEALRPPRQILIDEKLLSSQTLDNLKKLLNIQS